MPRLQPISQQNFQVTISDDGTQLANIYFNKVSRPGLVRSQENFNDGQTGQIFKHLGLLSTDIVTLTKIWSPSQDIELLNWANDRIKSGGELFTVVVQPVQSTKDAEPVEGSNSWNYSGCQLVAFRPPEVDRDASGLATIELEIDYENLEYT